MIEAVSDAARLAKVQLIAWLGAPQLKSPLTESTTRRPSTVSVRVRLSASDTPQLVTSMVNVWLPVPASTALSVNVLVTPMTTSSTMSIVVGAGGRAGEVVGVGAGGVADGGGRLGRGRDVVGHGDRGGVTGIEGGRRAVDRLARQAAGEVAADRVDDQPAVDGVGQADVVGLADARVGDVDLEAVAEATGGDTGRVERLGRTDDHVLFNGRAGRVAGVRARRGVRVERAV